MRTDKMKKIAAAVLALMMAVLCLTACGAEKKTVTVIDGNVKTEVEVTVGEKVSQALESAGIKLGANDVCEPAVSAEIGSDTAVITVKRADASDASAVNDADSLKRKELSTGEGATQASTEAATEAPTSKVEFKEEKKTEKIPYTTEEDYSDALLEGESEVTQYGVEGEKEITYRVKYVDGKEDSREKVSEKVTKQPVSEIITYGTGSADSGNGGASGGRTEISRVPYYDCDGSGHGYWEITYDDGSVDYETF